MSLSWMGYNIISQVFKTIQNKLLWRTTEIIKVSQNFIKSDDC